MPRCKTCKQKFTPKTFNQKNCFDNDECIKAEFLLKRKNTWDKEKKEKEPVLKPQKFKLTLAKECQKLARMIDTKFGYNCIDCDRPFAAQQDGGHFKSKGSNQSLAYNLHNIHSQRSECNCNGIGGGRERQYYNGLVKRYGQEYANYVDVGLQKEYKYIGLKNVEIPQKIEIVRKIIRDFDTFVLTDGKQARELFNTIIGIYA